MYCAVVSQASLCLWLSLATEPDPSANPRLTDMGPAGSVAVVAVVVALLQGAALVMRTSIQPRLRPGARRTRRVIGGVVGGLAAVAAASALGGPSAVVAAMVAAGAVFYVLVGRFLPPVGVVSLALLVTLTMAIPNPRLSDGLPLALTLLHVTLATSAHHHLANLRPKLASTDWVGIGAGWVFWTLGLVVLTSSRGGDAPALASEPAFALPLWVIPAAGLWVYAAVMVVALRRRMNAPRWLGISCGFLALYSVAWLVPLGMWGAAAWQGALLLGCLPACWRPRRGEAVRPSPPEPASVPPGR